MCIATHAGTTNIVDSDIKLIMGLIWTLILHYQISIGFGGKEKSKITPKQALMQFLVVSIDTE